MTIKFSRVDTIVRNLEVIWKCEFGGRLLSFRQSTLLSLVSDLHFILVHYS